jgi:hypothetical protein
MGSDENYDDDPDDESEYQDHALPKPNELLALHGVTTELFEVLGRWFHVPPVVQLDLHEIDSAVVELGDPTMIAALAMRKLQALHLLSTPGVRTTTDVVVTIVQDLQRALIQAPTMRLRLAAASTDWDKAFAMLDSQDQQLGAAPLSPDEDDPEVERYAELCGRVLAAMNAVVEVSNGQICELV